MPKISKTIITTAYNTLVAQKKIYDNAQQRQILPIFDQIATDLTNHKKKKNWLFKNLLRTQKHSLYLYGSIGVGKTFLLNLLFSNINNCRKKRLHFHDFMRYIDTQLRNLQGKCDPIIAIATELSTSIDLLYIDEFFITDVLHALTLTKLLPILMQKHLTIIISSNIQPDNLYLNGIQRTSFLPTIELIKQHFKIINLNNQHNYRAQQQNLQNYLYPLNTNNIQQFTERFVILEPHATHNSTIRIQKRDIPYIQCGQHAIWFDFKTVCNIPRSQLDYLELSEKFKIIFISDIPQLTPNDQTLVLLFIYLIDILYDNKNTIIISAQVSINELYTQGNMLQIFQRTKSRLQEMLADHHGNYI